MKFLVVGRATPECDELTRLLREAMSDGPVCADAVLGPRAGAANAPRYDLVVADCRLGDRAAVAMLRRLRRREIPTPVLYVGCENVAGVVAMMRQGAAYCLPPDPAPQVLAASIRRILRSQRSEQARREAEIALKLNEASLRTLVERSADAILVVDPEGAVLFANPASEVLFGRPASELLGQPFGFPVAGETQTHIDLLGPSRQPISADMRVVETVWQGNPAFLATLRDTTERDRAEVQMRLANAALERRVAERTTQLEAAAKAKDQFLAQLSHELRTPLSPVLMAISAMEQRPDLPPDLLQDVRLVRRSVELEAKLIDDLLDLTRITRGKLQLHLATIDVHQCLRHALDICCGEICAKSLDVSLELTANPSFVHVDPDRLQQVFWNLVKNAVKFTPANGKVRISSRNSPPNHVSLTISDTGAGISPEILPRLFQPFEQGGTAITKEFGGLGLGLFVSRAIIEAHGGTISAESSGPNRGSMFTFELPLADAPSAAFTVAPVAGTSLKPVRILLVEDHVPTLRIMSRILGTLGHDLRTASSVATALDHVAKDPVDLIISDLGLPDGTGHDLMLAAKRVCARVKGIALSGYGMEHDVAKSLEVGFTLHLTKPVNIQRLQAAIVDVLT